MKILVCDPISPKGIALLQQRPEFEVVVLPKGLAEPELVPLLKDVVAMVVLFGSGVPAEIVHGGYTNITFGWGLGVTMGCYVAGRISGAHLNPAVTLGALVGGKIKVNDALVYMVMQLVGGVVGALFAQRIVPEPLVTAASLGTPMLAPNISMYSGILMEAIMTFFLVASVFGTALDNRAAKVGGLFIGLTITLDILAGGPITGASMNPARTFGPAIVGGYWNNHIVYWIGPLIGGAAAGLLYSKHVGKQGM